MLQNTPPALKGFVVAKQLKKTRTRSNGDDVTVSINQRHELSMGVPDKFAKELKLNKVKSCWVGYVVVLSNPETKQVALAPSALGAEGACRLIQNRPADKLLRLQCRRPVGVKSEEKRKAISVQSEQTKEGLVFITLPDDMWE
jgi:hypothetical protein